MQNTILKYSITVVRKSELVEHELNNKSESINLHSLLKCHITKQLLTSISVDMGIYLPLKVICT